MLHFKNFIKIVASKIPIGIYRKALPFPLIDKIFYSLSSCIVYPTRESLWEKVIDYNLCSRKKIMYIEFGVYEGYSINFFSKVNENLSSVFIGLDSFEGLPERWREMPAGTFGTSGKMPNIIDTRVSFIKGWFQSSWPQLALRLSIIDDFEEIIVHFDADLYSSTLFCLCKMDSLGKSYTAIFDQFTGDEAIALHDYSQSHNADVEFFGNTKYEGDAAQVWCVIKPRLAKAK